MWNGRTFERYFNRKRRVLKALAVMVLIAAGVGNFLARDIAAAAWIRETMGGPRWSFGILFIGVLIPVVGLKLVFERRSAESDGAAE